MAETKPYDRLADLKTFDETKKGAKGLADSGLAVIPRFFHDPSVPDLSTPAGSSVAIPTVDLRRPIAEVVEGIRAAAAGWGFFQVVGHGVPIEAMEGMIGGVSRFFEGDAEEKKAFYSRDTARKVRWNSNHDLFRSRAASWRDSLALVTGPDPLPPEEIPEPCRDSSLEYLKHAVKLGEHLLTLLSQSLGLDPSHLNAMGCSKGHFFLSHYYPPCPQPELTFGTRPHRDSSFLTILLQDQLGGLEVLHDERWVQVPPTPGALVVNIGDLLQLLSNDKFISVEHRVVAKRKGPRISVAFFFNALFGPSSDVVLGPVKELLSEDDPPLYREVSVGDYVARYASKELGDQSPLPYFRL